MKTIRDFERYLLNNCSRTYYDFDQDYTEAGFNEPAWAVDTYYFEDTRFCITENSANSRFETGYHKKYDISIEENGEEVIYSTDSLSDDFSKLKKFLMRISERNEFSDFSNAINILFDFEVGGGGMMYDYK